MTYYQTKGEEGFKSLWFMVKSFFVLSFIVFLASTVSQSVLSMREYLYRGIDWTDTLSDMNLESRHFRQGGLASTLFYFSYQIAAGISIFFADVLIGNWRRMALPIACLGLGLSTLVIAGERSPIVAIVFPLLMLFALVGRQAYKRFVLSSLFLLLLFVLLTRDLSTLVEQRGPFNLIERLAMPESNIEAGSRIKVQLWAFTEILFHPLGIIWTQESYDTLIGKSALEMQISPHNGYLTRTLYFGWPLAIIVILIFRKVYQMGRIVIKSGNPTAMSVLAAVVAVLVNALFHNPSFLTFEPVTVFLLMLLACLADSYVKTAKTLTMPPQRGRDGA